MVSYDDETLQQINNNANLLNYVSQYMTLEKRGNDYFTHCIKHTDNTPSLSFSPDKNSYYCFSCGRSGGFIGFLMDYEDLSFEEAVEKAAKISSIDLSQMCHSPTIIFLRKLKKIQHKHKEKYIHPIIDEKEYQKYKQEPVQEWLDEGIKQDVMELFGIKVDIFQNRIVYPVYDIDNNLINIKGRTRYKDYKRLKISKYMNYYSVGVMDYFQGLNITIPYVKEKNEVIIFESIKSVMLAYGWGYKNCVSAEKHTLTMEQIELLIKLKVNIVIAYDSDVDYNSADVKKGIDKLKRLTNVFIVKDYNNLLGGEKAKNAPVDLGETIWNELYKHKKKVI